MTHMQGAALWLSQLDCGSPKQPPSTGATVQIPAVQVSALEGAPPMQSASVVQGEPSQLGRMQASVEPQAHWPPEQLQKVLG
jgi:hypothetical protein